MGICASSQTETTNIGALNCAATAHVIGLDGRLQEFKLPVRAGHILSQNPNCFLCNSESMHVGSHVRHELHEEELQLGQIYFLMPLKRAKNPLALQELCALAVKASTALANSDAGVQKCGKLPTDFDMVGGSIYLGEENRGVRSKFYK